MANWKNVAVNNPAKSDVVELLMSKLFVWGKNLGREEAQPSFAASYRAIRCRKFTDLEIRVNVLKK